MSKTLKTQTAWQLSLWITGMAINYFIDGHVLIGGSIGMMGGLLAVIYLNFHE